MSKAIIPPVDTHTHSTVCSIARHKTFSVCMNSARHCLISSYLSVIGLTLYFTTQNTKTSPTVILLNLIYVERHSQKKPGACIYIMYTHSRTHNYSTKRENRQKVTQMFPIFLPQKVKPNQTKSENTYSNQSVAVHFVCESKYIYIYIFGLLLVALFCHSHSPFRQVKISFGWIRVCFSILLSFISFH